MSRVTAQLVNFDWPHGQAVRLMKALAGKGIHMRRPERGGGAGNTIALVRDVGATVHSRLRDLAAGDLHQVLLVLDNRRVYEDETIWDFLRARVGEILPWHLGPRPWGQSHSGSWSGGTR